MSFFLGYERQKIKPPTYHPPERPDHCKADSQNYPPLFSTAFCANQRFARPSQTKQLPGKRTGDRLHCHVRFQRVQP